MQSISFFEESHVDLRLKEMNFPRIFAIRSSALLPETSESAKNKITKTVKIAFIVALVKFYEMYERLSQIGHACDDEVILATRLFE